ncbi:hypothetical protein D6C90_02630 [Aureobasidium pullulans]|uniref:Sld7 C-terminal domain-containing protein n=1 Tax=Aureobasidium pullulans TaxID=5580 RepID=A0A4S9VEP3_AURPU|nr:hypothetical protein D6C90_02630 [Aureobasidium pullulans]
MDIWNGNLRLDDINEIRGKLYKYCVDQGPNQEADIRISAPSTKLPLPNDCTLQFLSHVDTTRIPLQLICGPRLDVSTADPDTETWFSNLLLSSNDAEEQGTEWWPSAALESPLGILAAVQVADSSSIPQPRTTEILFYAARRDVQRSPPTPPHNEASSSDMAFGLYALPLSSDLLLSNEVEVTPPSSPILSATDTSTPTGRFIPHPWDGPSLRQKRKTAIDSTFSAAEDHRRNLKRHLGASVAAAAASNSPSLPSLPRLKSEQSRGSVPLLTRPKSRSPSIASLRRENTGTAAETRRVSGLSRETPVPTTTQTAEEEALEKKNKDMISKVVLAGLRVWGFSSSSKRKKRASTSIASEPPTDPTEEARDEEYKLLYHHVYKSTCFAFRVGIAKQDLSGKEFADRVRDMVDSFLGIFCKDPLEKAVDGDEMKLDDVFKGAVVRTPKGELGEQERGLR